VAPPVQPCEESQRVSRLLLLSVAGADHPDLLATVTDELMRRAVDVRELGQSVIHDHATLGLVVAVDDADRGPLEAALRERVEGLGARLEAAPMDDARWDAWRRRQARPRWIVTLLARRLDAAHFARVADIVRRHGLHVDAVRRLSDGPSRAGAPSRASVEIALRGAPPDAAAIRGEFLAVSGEFGIDVAFQRDDVYRRNRRLVAFDMDSTLIEAEVIDELAAEAGVGEAVAAITERAMRGELDFSESFRERVALLEGLDASVLERVAERLPLTEGAEQLIGHLRRLGYRTAILSGGFQWFAERLRARLGIDWVHANELEVVDGRVTGRVVGQVVDGERKAALLKQIAAEEGIALDQVIAVGDGANDLPMLSVAGLGIAFRAKPLVRESAEQSLSALGLDAILYLLGFTDADLA
jgi:phosphoserine phosphatase